MFTNKECSDKDIQISELVEQNKILIRQKGSLFYHFSHLWRTNESTTKAALILSRTIAHKISMFDRETLLNLPHPKNFTFLDQERTYSIMYTKHILPLLPRTTN